jgi:acetyl esterase/lipase
VLVIGSEGADCVPYFASHGVSTVILRERLRIDGYNMVTDAMDDTFQAIRLVRSHAEEWGLDPNKIGIMGFSAGAELAAAAAIEYDAWDAAHAETLSGAGDALGTVSCRPDFVGLLYPVRTSLSATIQMLQRGSALNLRAAFNAPAQGPTPFQNKESREITGCTRLQGGGWSDDRDSEPDPVRPEIPRDVPPSFIATPSSGDRIHAIWAAEYFCAHTSKSVCSLVDC